MLPLWVTQVSAGPEGPIALLQPQGDSKTQTGCIPPSHTGRKALSWGLWLLWLQRQEAPLEPWSPPCRDTIGFYFTKLL